MTSKLVHVINAGRTPYREGLNLQRFISNQIIENKWNYKNVLILTEHDPVYTIGWFTYYDLIRILYDLIYGFKICRNKN